MAALVALAAACDSTNPVAPDPPQPPTGGASSYAIELAASPPRLELGAGEPSVISVTVRAMVGGPQPADGTALGLSTDLGSFGTDGAGKPVTVTTLRLKDGKAEARLFPSEAAGTAHLLAQFETATEKLDVPIQEPVVVPFFLIAVDPGFGSASGGTPVTIRGSGFVAPVRVTFGSVVAEVREVAADRVRAIAPRPATPVEVGETAIVDVTVTNNLGATPAMDTLAGAFTYTVGGGLERPVILSVQPRSGPNEGGTEVSLRGSGFETLGNVQVFFGLRGAAGFDGIQADVVAASPTEVRVISPAAASPGQSLLNRQVDVLLSNLRSGFSTTAAAAFKYTGQQLLVSTMDPRKGPYQGGTRVEIRGQGFVAPVEVQFGGTAQDVLSVSADGTLIQARSVEVQVKDCQPPSGPLTVKNLNTAETAATGFLFDYTAAPPVVASVSPPRGPQAGGNPVTIQGSGFEDNSKVEFGGVVAVGPQVGLGAITVPAPAFTGKFEEDPCDANGDGHQGARSKPKAVDVKVTSIDTGCAVTFPQGYTYEPADLSCRGDSAAPPVADFDFAVSGLMVRFSDRSGGGPPSTWQWDFGEPASGGNNSSSAPNPSHTYNAPETYLVRLTVSNSAGANSVAKPVAVTSPAPQAGFTWTVTSVAARTVQFTDASTGGPPTAWAWNFGDPASGSNTSTQQNPVHAFSTPGTYTVTLIVSNAAGSTSQPQFVTVPAPPP